ncbi:class I SAM-dependent methyltransferase [Nocardiopsis sp. NPDC006139]|uniref:class I SAM-dependent methyltransferase n=1 Tax=Nocardiopsis sp. NPDC006139 TaxID=3154578 RepID=UPI0033BE0FCF
MVDRHFSEPDLADLYDYFNPWGSTPQDDFYLDLVLRSRAVLDVGCGTGKIQRVARERGHTGRLVGLDPAAAMLEVGRRDRGDVEWIHGDLLAGPYDDPGHGPFTGAFDLVMMSGHAFQVFTSDEELHAVLAAVRRALVPGGRFAFETRNPAVRGWEAWTPERVRTVQGPGGRRATCVHRLREVRGDLVTFTSDYRLENWAEPVVSRSTLRFLDAGTLDRFLARAGLVVDERYGYWDRTPLTATSTEIITLARPA